MRFIKMGMTACVAVMVSWVGFLAIRSIQLEGMGIKSCLLLSGPFLIWLAYQNINLMVDKVAKRRTFQLSSNNQNKTAEEINCLKKTTSDPNEMSDWQDLAASLERRVDE